MSLLLTSSSEGAGQTNQIGISVPYQYRNHLKNPLIVEPLSEIAVESVKINRVPQIDYAGGLVNNLWFGERLVADQFDLSLSYFIPCENIIDEGNSPADFAEKFTEILKENYSVHPEINSKTIEVNIVTGTNGDFTGFQFKIPQVGVKPTSTIPPAATRTMEDTRISLGSLDWDGTSLTADGDEVLGQLQPINAQGGPLSLFGGSCTFNEIDTAGNLWTVGVSRAIGIVEVGDDEYASQDTDVLFGGGGNIRTLPGTGPAQDGMMDYCAQSGPDGLMRLYHAVADTSGTGPPVTCMEEVKYYEKNDGAFTKNNVDNSSFATSTPIPSASITDITFIASGENMMVTASGKVVCNASLINASTKSQVMKPIGQTCWKLYPTVHLWAEYDNCELAIYECRTSTTIYNNQPENSWVTRCTIPTWIGDGSGGALDQLTIIDQEEQEVSTPPWNNANRWPNSLDYRPCYQILNADSSGYVSATSLGPAGTTKARLGIGAGTMTSYENIFILGPSDRYMPRQIQGWQPNSAGALGFTPFGINPDSGMLDGAYDGASFTSTTKPSSVSTQSTFIRVPTLSHETYNFGTGNPSKILFQVPRFDNSGAETGGLFFQNPDKTYVDLKNINELRITDLDVQFVRKDERFAKDLTGSSEVVFHIRKKSRM